MPLHDELATKTPQFILNAMFGGTMTAQAAGLSLEEGRAIARFITRKEFEPATTAAMGGRCAGQPPRFSLSDGDWNGWGADLDNSRFQPKPGLAPSDVPKLQLKWAFGFAKDPMAWAQPVVAGGRVFAGSVAGSIYSLDASSGCVYWSYAAGAPIRTAVSIGRLSPGGWAAYFGDIKAILHAVDAETGARLWTIKLDDHPVARITGSPILVNGKLFVPMSSIEEASAQAPNYACCTFRGSVSAVDAATGRLLWKSYSVSDPPMPYKTSKNGVQLQGPAGAAIWSAPTADVKRGLIYAGTGNSYAGVPINTSDAILAFDMDTGKLVWSSQVQPKDNFVIGCPDHPNCPDEHGPDFDFGASPVLRTLPGGKQVLIAAQKSGVVYGLDPDNQGKILWQTRVGKGSALGGIEWGQAADDKLVYAPVSDRWLGKNGAPGLYALDPLTGAQKWAAPAPAESRSPGQSAAVSVIPGVVFSGALDGHFRAYSTANGAIVWDFDTNRAFQTVNGVEAKGGSIDAGGPAIVHGMVFTNSGYGIFGGTAGNVLLAFSVDGK